MLMGNQKQQLLFLPEAQQTNQSKNKPVKLETTLGTVKEDQLQTSKTGMAEFHLSSTNPGSATVHAIINKTVKTNQKVTITFK